MKGLFFQCVAKEAKFLNSTCMLRLSSKLHFKFMTWYERYTSLSHTLSLTHTHTHSLSLSHTHTHTLSLYLSLSLFLTHTHKLGHRNSLTRFHYKIFFQPKCILFVLLKTSLIRSTNVVHNVYHLNVLEFKYYRWREVKALWGCIVHITNIDKLRTEK